MAFLFDPNGRPGADYPSVIEQARATVKRRSAALLAVGRRRVIYCAGFAYWTCVHRSAKHAAWVLEYEGLTWN